MTETTELKQRPEDNKNGRDSSASSQDSDRNSKKSSCEVCNFKPEAQHSFLIHEHHIHPKKDGGKDEDDNYMYVCIGCHAIIHALIKSGDIQQSLGKSGFKYRYGGTIHKARIYRESGYRRGRKKPRFFKGVPT